MQELTVVVGVDAHTFKFFERTAPNWLKFHPWLKTSPWVVFYHGVDTARLEQVTSQLGCHAKLYRWDGDYDDQRSRMLAGHVFVPCQFVTTPWWVKIDCDAFMVERSNPWPNPQWFGADAEGRLNCLVGSSWPYTRAKAGSGDLWDWCERLESWGDEVWDTPRLGLKDRIGSLDHVKGPKMHMTRLASWVCFHRTEWVREIAAICSRSFGAHQLPVPSHDTTLWYAAARSGARFQLDKQKRYGWTNRTTFRGTLAGVEAAE